MLTEPPFSILDTLNTVDDALDQNADLADRIVHLGLTAFQLSDVPSQNPEVNWQGKAKPGDISKAHSTIRQFYRDWSREGFAREVEPILNVLVSDLQTNLPLQSQSQTQNLLVPGAGLGRLLFELALRGYHVTGNEISYHQLLASNFILNSTQRVEQYAIYPFAHTFTNIISRSDQLKKVDVPDVHPGEAFSTRQAQGARVGEMNMTAGDFVLSYSNPESKETFDGVVSVFFIDTAPNLIRYIETVKNCLRPGGAWINIGPLLWHFDDRPPQSQNTPNGDASAQNGPDSAENGDASLLSQDAGELDLEDKGIAEPGSFELTDEEVIQLVSTMGFEVVKHEILNSETGYIQDPASLLQNRYKLSHWVAKKV
jgi:carnosine N-methyltransferase